MARRSNLTQAEKDCAIHLTERGFKAHEVARSLRCSIGSVNWTLLRAGVMRPGFKPRAPDGRVQLRNGHTVRRFTADEDRQLLELEAQGLTWSEMGRRLGRRPNSIGGRLATLARHEEARDV